jgi:hypothetical protein
LKSRELREYHEEKRFLWGPGIVVPTVFLVAISLSKGGVHEEVFSDL